MRFQERTCFGFQPKVCWRSVVSIGHTDRFALDIVRTGSGCALRFAGRELPIGRLGEKHYAVELEAGEAPMKWGAVVSRRAAGGSGVWGHETPRLCTPGRFLSSDRGVSTPDRMA